MACVTSAAANWYHTLPSSGQGGRMFSAGQNLRALRESLGLKMRDVEGASARIARKHQNEEFAIPPSRLSDIETKGVVPSIYRVYALAVIYRRDARELLSWYGVDFNYAASDLGLASPPKSIRVRQHHQEAEVIGQVVGVAMRLGEWHHHKSASDSKEHAALN